jgi:hypothetical protein
MKFLISSCVALSTLLLLNSISFADAEAGTCSHPEAAPAAAASNEKLILRGEKLPDGKYQPVAEVLAVPQRYSGKSVQLEGKVRRVCSHKGCWMELASDEKGPGVRVTFKDYGFFVPTNSQGAQARVAGTLQVAELSAEQVQHLEGEGATVPRDAAGKPQEVQLVATGVELRR